MGRADVEGRLGCSEMWRADVEGRPGGARRWVGTGGSRSQWPECENFGSKGRLLLFTAKLIKTFLVCVCVSSHAYAHVGIGPRNQT